MWETIKNDPILKAITIIVLSVLGFGFAFNIMFGSNSNSMGNEGEMGGSGAFKLLLIALVVIAFAAIIKYAKKHLYNGGEIKMFEQIKKDPILKGATVTVLIVLAAGLIYFLFSSAFGTGGGYAMNVNGMMTSGYGYNMMGNSGYGLGLSNLLTILLKILLFVSAIGLISGLAMYVKQSYFKEIAGKIAGFKAGNKVIVKCSNCGAETLEKFKFCPSCGEKTREECPSCGAELKAEWKCCPSCGSEKSDASKEREVNQE